MSAAASAICLAIRDQRRIAFVYNGRERVVEPYCHSWDDDGVGKLRAVQVRGDSSSRQKIESGKLWFVKEMRDVSVLDAGADLRSRLIRR